MGSIEEAIEEHKFRHPIVLEREGNTVRLSPGGYLYVTWRHRTLILTQQDTRALFQFLQDGLRIAEEKNNDI